MKRRTLLGGVSATWLISLPGCAFQNYSDRDQGSHADLVVWNLTERSQNVTVLIEDESRETIHQEQYELSPEDTENYNQRESEVVRTNRDYHLEVEANGRQATDELGVPQPGVVDITIHEGEIEFDFGPVEG